MDEYGSKIIGVIVGAVVIFSLQAFGVHKLLANIFGGVSSATIETYPINNSEDEIVFWQSTDKCGTDTCYRAYLQKYPQGQFVILAQAQLESKNIQIKNTQETPKVISSKLVNTNKYYGKYPETSTRYLTPSDLKGKSVWNLQIMRNEIFARHGYIFENPKIKQYFQQQTWYKPEYYDVGTHLTSIEKANAKFIRKHETQSAPVIMQPQYPNTINGIIGSRKTKKYNGIWEGISVKVYIKWEIYTGSGGRVDGVVESSKGKIITTFTGRNYAFRKLKVLLSNNNTLYLKAKVEGLYKVWMASNIEFSRKHK